MHNRAWQSEKVDKFKKKKKKKKKFQRRCTVVRFELRKQNKNNSSTQK